MTNTVIAITFLIVVIVVLLLYNARPLKWHIINVLTGGKALNRAFGVCANVVARVMVLKENSQIAPDPNIPPQILYGMLAINVILSMVPYKVLHHNAKVEGVEFSEYVINHVWLHVSIQLPMVRGEEGAGETV